MTNKVSKVKVFLIASGILLISVFVFLVYSGLLMPVVIEEKPMGPYLFVYKTHKGPYQNIGKVIESVSKSLKDDYKLDSKLSFGMYLDNPDAVKKEDLRSYGGVIVEQLDADGAARLSSAFEIMEYPRNMQIVAEYPYKNIASLIIGISKVYKAFMKHMDLKGYAPTHSIEIYDMAGGKTIYMMPVVLK